MLYTGFVHRSKFAAQWMHKTQFKLRLNIDFNFRTRHVNIQTTFWWTIVWKFHGAAFRTQFAPGEAGLKIGGNGKPGRKGNGGFGLVGFFVVDCCVLVLYSLIISYEAFSAIMTTGAHVLAFVTLGIMEASTTLKFFTPITLLAKKIINKITIKIANRVDLLWHCQLQCTLP